MDDKLHKYILLNDRVGEHTEKGLLSLSTKNIPTQFLRGELLEALIEADQPKDPEKIALTGIAKKNQRLECPTSEVAKLTDSEADLLVAVSSAEERFRIYRERNRLELAKSLTVSNKVLVKLKNIPRDALGVIWYIGPLPTNSGKMFGVQLLSKEALGLGTTDGTFRNQRFFDCPQDCGVFVPMDKIRPIRESSRSPRRDAASPQKSPKTSFNLKDMLTSGFRTNKRDQYFPNYSGKLSIDQKVVVFLDEKPVRGFVRYIAESPESDGSTPIGLELKEKLGTGTGMFKGKQRFVCQEGYALFARASTIIPEEDFLGHQEHERLSKSDGLTSMSLGDDVNTGRSSPRHTKIKRSNSSDEITDPKVIKQQNEILQAIKAEQASKSEQETGRVPEHNLEGAMDFTDDHYKRSPHGSSSYIRVQPGNSRFYGKKSDVPLSTADKVTDSYIDSYNKEIMQKKVSRGSHQISHCTDSPSSVPTSQSYSSTTDPSTASPLPTEASIEGVVRCSNDGHVEHHFKGGDDIHATIESHVQEINVLTKEEDLHLMGLEIGSMVEVPMTNNRSQYGVIRWIGKLPDLKDRIVAGLELEEEQASCNDGVFHGIRYFTCPPGRGFFVNLANCRKDSRFLEKSLVDVSKYTSKAFGSLDSPIVEGTVPPPDALGYDRQGKMRGIQGHHNSCYLDATLFSMFAFTTVFDSLLYRSKTETDLDQYETVQKVLKDGIVNPLRSNGFVRADRVLQLRKLLDELGSTSGLMNEEKDPEEFLNTLLQQVLKSEPLLKLKIPNNRCEESNYYQIITEKDEMIQLASVQQLVEQSFLFSDLKLSEVPSCLILQMPRFGNKYKMYDIILPDLKLDITHILENVPRECSVCGNVSSFECKECYKANKVGISSLCKECNKTWHRHSSRLSHQPTPILVPREYSKYVTEYGSQYSTEHPPIDKQIMELFAVVCINTSHYVAFVKCGTIPGSEWCFFDSMADRKGEKNGYNIPSVTPCPEASKWLNANPEEIVSANKNGELPPSMKRLFGDAYMCLYQNLEITMYK